MLKTFSKQEMFAGKPYIIHNLCLSEFAVAGEGTVMCKEMNLYFIVVDFITFPTYTLPSINCGKVIDVWFDCFCNGFFLVPCCLLFICFIPVLALLIWFFSSQKLLSSNYNKLPAEMQYWSIFYKSKRLRIQTVFSLIEWTTCSIVQVTHRKRLVRSFENSHNLQQIYGTKYSRMGQVNFMEGSH